MIRNVFRIRTITTPVRTALTSVNSTGPNTTTTTSSPTSTTTKSSNTLTANKSDVVKSPSTTTAARKSVAKPLTTPPSEFAEATTRSTGASLLDNDSSRTTAKSNNNNNNASSAIMPTHNESWTQQPASNNGATTSEPAVNPSYDGISFQPFSAETCRILQEPIRDEDVEIKPDGTIYLPEIKYRRRLNQAFGPGAWAMKPIGAVQIEGDVLTRAYQLFCFGRFVSQATGEQKLRQGMTQATAEESAKSNALMRCCKDLGISSELWDPHFIGSWRTQHALEIWATNTKSNEKRRLWRKRGSPPLPFPWREENASSTVVII